MEFDIVTLSRLQFAMTALYHFLFVPLTLGLSILLAIMETTYVLTGREIWKQMTKFWGVLFGINFALGVSTGIVMEFQFGMNWSYYSHYVGDIFGAPLAIEALMAFFLESTFVGLFFFGWDRLSKIGHAIVTWLVAIGSNLSAMWILIANGWMQNPIGSTFNPYTMRMEITDFYEVLFNISAQTKFIHTACAGYVTASVFVIGVSAWYLLKGRVTEFAKRSIILASAFGFAASLMTVITGDEAGFTTRDHQPMKLAAMEAMWETEPAPAAFTLMGFPDQESRETHYAVKIPWAMGILGTRSFNTPIEGINELVDKAKDEIRKGIIAYDALNIIREAAKNKTSVAPDIEQGFLDNQHSLGYALLLKRYVDDPRTATEEQIVKAANDTVPWVSLVFWSFRIMVGLGFYLFLFFGLFYVLSVSQTVQKRRWLLWLAVLSLPVPWVAAEAGWMVAEMGRQPWIIEGILPTAVAVSNLSAQTVLMTILGFSLVYTILIFIEMGLMVRSIRRGPEAEIAYHPIQRLSSANATITG